MVYEQLMMDSATLMRFRIFRYLMHNGKESYSISQMADDMNLNYQQAVIDLTEIDEELAELNPKHESILIGAGKVNCQNLSSTIDEYRYYLLKKSVPFQFILYFLNEENPSITDYCDRYGVSRSTVSRKTKKLKEFLKVYHLRLTYTEANLVGDERLVRMMLFNLIWLGTRGIEIPLNVDLNKVEELVETASDYFPLNNSFFGSLEIRYFAALYLVRIAKGNFVKYDRRYNFLMKKNSYYDFDRMNNISKEFDLTPKQQKAESSFIFFLSHYVPFYTSETEASLQQTIYDFSSHPNPVYDLNMEFLDFVKKNIFMVHPEVADNPLILGNLLNIGFTFYVTEQPIPNIQALVIPHRDQEQAEFIMEEKINKFFDQIEEKEQYAFVRKVKHYMVKSYKNILLPYYSSVDYSYKLKVGLAMEQNYLLVKWLHQFLEGLRFVEFTTYNPSEQNVEDFDLVISSSLILKQQNPDLPVYLWDLAGGDDESMQLYQYLKKLYNEKNLHHEDEEEDKKKVKSR